MEFAQQLFLFFYTLLYIVEEICIEGHIMGGALVSWFMRSSSDGAIIILKLRNCPACSRILPIDVEIYIIAKCCKGVSSS